MRVNKHSGQPTSIPTRGALFFIRVYQIVFSPLFGNQCRYHPTCSNYAMMAFNRYGFFTGLRKTIWRILRCNPFSNGGIDFP